MNPILLILGCAATPTTDDSAAPPVDDRVDPPLEEVPGLEDGSDALFGHERVHEVVLTVAPDDIDALWADPYGWVPGEATFDGAPLGTVGVRLKGRIGSFRELDEKAAFKLDLNRYDGVGELLGLKQLTLNNAVVDCSYGREYLGWAVYRAAGVPSSRAGYANVTLNGRDYGLHTLIESQDDGFLERWYEHPDGNLYDGKYAWNLQTREYTLLDLRGELVPLFEQEEGEDVGHADLAALVAALDAWGGQPGFYEALAPLVDWDAFHRMVAVSQWIGHVDGYSMNTNNYRIYFDPSDGRASFIPWDLDYGFIAAHRWNRSWATPRGRLTALCWVDEDCRARQAEVVAEVNEAADALALDDVVDELADDLDEAVRADPFRTCSMSEHDRALLALRSWVRGASDDMRDFWDL